MDTRDNPFRTVTLETRWTDAYPYGHPHGTVALEVLWLGKWRPMGIRTKKNGRDLTGRERGLVNKRFRQNAGIRDEDMVKLYIKPPLPETEFMPKVGRGHDRYAAARIWWGLD